MNSEANDSTDATVGIENSETVESIAETSGESRTDRIRRLNRERQRRRREKLRMSRQSEAPSTTSNDVDPSNDVDLLSEGCAIVEVTLPLKVETEVPEETEEKPTPKTTRPKRSTRTRQKISRREATAEQTTSDTVSSANNAISPPCHENNSKYDGASEESTVLVVASEVEVVDEKPQENGTEEPAETPESKADGKRRRLRESTKRQTDKSPEDVATKRVVREREKRKMHDLPDEVTARREKQRELKRKQKERMSNEQIEALRARYREWRRKRKETMTSEQLEVIRKGNRERQRRRRERLGIRKRSTTPQTKGASEAVIQGIKNKQAQIIKPLESNLTPEASLVAAVNQVASLNSVEAASAAASLMPNPSRIEGPVAVTVEVNPGAPGMTPNVAQNTQTVVGQPPSSAGQILSLPVTSANVTQGSLPPGMPMLGPQGTILQGLPPGSGTLYSMSMPGIQGTLLSGVPVTAGQAAVQGNNVAGMPFTGMQGLVPGMTAQGAFLPASQAGVLPGMQTFSSMAPTMTKDGQILHSISTLLPIAPMQGIQGTGQSVAFLAPMPIAGPTGQVQAFQDMRGAVATPIKAQSPGTGTMVASVPIAESVTAETVAVVAPGDGSDTSGQDSKVKTAEQPKPRGRRGRKRTTSAAEMLANLSNLPPMSTPMSSMLSALASQVRENSHSSVVTVEKDSEPPAKRAAGDASQVPAVKRAPSQNLSQLAVMAGNVPSTGPNTVTYTESTFPVSNSGAKIPHMSTFLNPMGGGQIPSMGVPFARPVNTFPPGVQAMPGQFFAPKVSVGVATEEISKTTVGTNTESSNHVENNGIYQSAAMSSIGTMTDSLYKVSVGTLTGQNNDQPLDGNTNCNTETVLGDSLTVVQVDVIAPKETTTVVHPQEISPEEILQEALNPEQIEPVVQPLNGNTNCNTETVLEDSLTVVQVDVSAPKETTTVVHPQNISPEEILQEALNPEQIEPVVVIPEDVVEEVVEVAEVAKITPIGDAM